MGTDKCGRQKAHVDIRLDESIYIFLAITLRWASFNIAVSALLPAAISMKVTFCSAIEKPEVGAGRDFAA